VLVRDLVCAALGWALAAACWIGSSRLQKSLLSDAFGADGLPRGLAVVLAVVSTLIAVRALWVHRRAASDLSPDATTSLEHARALGILAIGAAYVILTPLIGYLPGAALVLIVTTLYYGAPPRLSLFVVSVAGATFLWFLFARVLSVSMPTPAWMRLFG
jgi:putative tricarboxylic transport membrane protein